MSMVDLPDNLPDLSRVRVFMAIIIVGLIAILSRLWYLQIAHGDELLVASIVNQRRLIRQTPPRGRIEDCRGNVLAFNRCEIVVSVIPEEIRKNPGTLARLAALLGKGEEDLQDTIDHNIEHNGGTPFDPVRIEQDVNIEMATRIEEQRSNLPGVLVGPEPIRSYPDGLLCGHLLGQMGQIQADELQARRIEGYRPGDYCGKLGLERAYDPELRGVNGGRVVEVDARGRMLREAERTDPTPGDRLTLTLDKTLQKIAYEALASKNRPGAAVALNPRTGAVLAMASYPSYDPNIFVKGVTREDWTKLQSDPLHPQIDRAVNSAYAPGSTFKLITATAGLDTGETNLHDTVTCNGGISLGRWYKKCHKPGGHGTVDLLEAIAKSCDVYFYRLGQRLGPDRIATYARMYGLGQRTGIDLMRSGDPKIEQEGLVPDPNWKVTHRRGPWVGGDTVDYAIGQSLLKCTPLQMCNVAATIANGGTLYRPQLVKTITAYDSQNRSHVVHRLEPEVIRHLTVSQTTLNSIIQGMREVMQPGGTGALSAIPGLNIAGKTGTAQTGRKGDNAWFVGFAPIENPQIAICVFVEGGGHGGETAAPIARKMFAHYFHIHISGEGGGGTYD